MNQELFTSVDTYIATIFAAEDEALKAARLALESANMPSISISPTQSQFLYLLALLCGAQQILEIGTLGGYSAIAMARAIPPGGRLVTIECSKKHAEVARANLAFAGLEPVVEVREGSALDVLPQLEAEGAGPFDLVFIDADKAAYPAYLDWSLRLARPGTLIVADNVVRHGAVLEADSSDPDLRGIQQFNAALAADPRLAATILPTVGVKGYDGFALVVVKQC